MDQQQLKAIIERYLEGRATPAEQAFIAQWLDEIEPDEFFSQTRDSIRPLKNQMLTDETAPDDTDLSDMEWDQLEADMLAGIRRGAGYEAPSFPGEEKRIIRSLGILKRIAAVLVLVAGGTAAFLYLRSWSVKPATAPAAVVVQEAAPAIQYQLVHTGAGNTKKITLPDGSIVTLNKASRLRYPAQFGKSREVYLEAGEAFFEVHTDAARPFMVHTSELRTRVLGTSFNVRARAGKINVMVKTGKVMVSTPVTARGPARDVVLDPNHALEVDTLSYSGRPYAAPAWIATAWCARRLEFRQHTLSDIIKALENRFDTQISLQSPALGQYRYTATFTAANSLDEILDALCLVHQLRYEQRNNKVTIQAINN
ncbi:FecR family protein [Chitinophaga japonensis]|uniref:FecR family protein n=1 Tax=Chitinophaga japonensis TaxID=104662 RepID=A0A562T6P7_CHIJA|nr:FecR domain-containing protein [Chitinophaga japonensis]TWI89219.1 FecR family protein [Chitinophaga japonensis]